MKLLDIDAWPSRPEDSVWQEKVLGMLAETSVAEAHIRAVREERGCLRFRPEEVAGAAAYSSYPVTFLQAEEAGAALVRELELRAQTRE